MIVTLNAPNTKWHTANQQYLTAAMDQMRVRLKAHAASLQADGGSPHKNESATTQELEVIRATMDSPPALETLADIFGLSAFERDVLLLCAAIEFQSGFGALCAQAQGDLQRPYPTFSLALAALDEGHWNALTPDAPLRYWWLVELRSDAPLTRRPLRIDERILHYLAGAHHVDERLAGMVAPVGDVNEVVPSHRMHVERLAEAWAHTGGGAALPVAHLSGGDVVSKRAIAAAVCAEFGFSLYAMSASAIPSAPGDMDSFIRLWEREAMLSRRALLVEQAELDDGEAMSRRALTRLIEIMRSPLLVSSRQRLQRTALARPVISFEVSKPTTGEQRNLWLDALGQSGATVNGQVEALVTHFNLEAHTIRAAGAAAAGRLALSQDADSALWEACRTQARPRMDNLAQHIESAAGWDDLVLPDSQFEVLREMVTHVRHRTVVYEKWGFAARMSRGLGISALFSGQSGTGKTLAAEVLAKELRLDLYRIDLSSVVSKYIGETEKNLRRVFDAGEESGSVLLFDEADALFGKRSEVKDSHDRYANIEVSYLLQRMENYRGLAILTTNFKSALDTAFMRRIRFIVDFPFPDAEQRAEIWRRIFPPETVTEGLDVNKLARLSIAGGSIRNIAMNAAFLAAEAGEPVRMGHLLRAAQTEYIKLERPLTGAEIGGWT